jgi:hypothetical protein
MLQRKLSLKKNYILLIIKYKTILGVKNMIYFMLSFSVTNQI